MIGGLQGEFGDLDNKTLKKNISKCRSQISGSTKDHFAGENEVCEISQTHKKGCEITSQQKADFTALRSWLSACSVRLPMAVTPSFQLQIAYCLKHWIADFLSFETTYSMHKLDSRNHFKAWRSFRRQWAISQPISKLGDHFVAKWHFRRPFRSLKVISRLRNECMGLPNGTRVTKSGFAVEKLPAEWGFAISQLRNEVHCAAKWHLCAKSWFCSYEIPCEMELWLRNWDFSCFGTSQPFRSCEMRVTVLRNGTRVPKMVSQQNGYFAAKWRFRSELVGAAKWFRNKVLISQRLRNLADPCFSPIFALFLLQMTFLHFFCNCS
uniref:Uncharacterized protein n=1 Tax=Vitis vinifera TaxID=29760 RepID=A5AH82_VITVI|nr:hypothetical protein VITISV_009023 [Vitis vinifera]